MSSSKTWKKMRRTINKFKSRILVIVTTASSGRYRDNTLVNQLKQANSTRKTLSSCRLLPKWMKIWASIRPLKSTWMLVFRLKLMLRLRPRPSRSNWSQKWLINPKTIRMICNCRCPWPVVMTPSTWVHFIWAPQLVSQPMLSLILAQSTWLWPLPFAMTRPLETSNLRSMIHYLAPLCRETSSLRGVELKPTTCTSQTPTRSCQKHHLNWHTDRLSSKASFGRTTPASSPWK